MKDPDTIPVTTSLQIDVEKEYLNRSMVGLAENDELLIIIM